MSTPTTGLPDRSRALASAAASALTLSDGSAPADPDAGLVAQSCFDFLLIELVPMAQRIANQLHESSLRSSGALPSSDDEPSTPAPDTKKPKKKRKGDPEPQPPEHKQRMDDDELREATFYRLEALGYRVGLGVVETISQHHPLISPTTFLPPPDPQSQGENTQQHPQPPNHLDTIKFLCKDFWTVCFRKQIDNLKTNHRGVFVLTDTRFEPLRRCSLPTNKPADEATRRASLFLFFPAGLVRGALSALGVEASVNAEVAGVGLPGVVFTIRTSGHK